MQVDMHAAKSQLSGLGELAWRGERIVITKAGRPYFGPGATWGPERKLGALKGNLWIAPDFDETPPEAIRDFEGG